MSYGSMTMRWLVLASVAMLVSCTGMPGPSTTLSPGAAACSVASLTNPAAAPSGLGGTGAPAVRGPDPGGIGGTGQVATGSGLGGTGAPVVAAGDPSGLGGTGAPRIAVAEPGMGGTGIVGVVTGFASICVNGVEVEYEPSVPIQRDGQVGQISDLAVGQVVALQASGRGDQLRAQRIEVLDAAVGPLTAVDAARGRFEVMGQRATALERDDLSGLSVGDWVRVSGQRVSSGEIRATRVQRANQGSAWVSGLYLGAGAQGARVGDTPVELTVAPPAGSEGNEVGARGLWVNGRLQVQAWRVQPAGSAVAGAREVLLQGYVHGVRGRELRLGYESLTLGEQLRVDGGDLGALRIDQRVQVRGRMDEQRRVTVERLEFRSEGRRGADRAQPAAPAAANNTAAPAAASDDSPGVSGGGRSGSDSGRGRGRGRGGDSGSSGSGSSGSGSSGSGSSGSGSSGSGSSGSGSSGSGSSGSGSSGSGSSGSGSSGSGSSGSGSSGGGSSGSGTSGSGSSGSGTSGSGTSGGDSDSGRGRGRGRGRGGDD